MNEQTKNELLEIASALCDEAATKEQRQRLEHLLSSEETATEIFSNYMHMHSELFWQQETLLSQVRLSGENRKQAEWSSLHWLMSLAAMLMVCAGLGVVISQLYSSSPNEIVAIELGGQVATITGTRNCRWSISRDEGTSSDPIGFGSKIRAGQNMELLEGIAEVTIDETGVRIILEAPANFVLKSNEESALNHGRLTASVPNGAEGFQVACQDLTLVDRGTEFGVSLDGEGETEVHVFDGLVDGYVNDSSGTTFRKVSWKTNDVVLFDSKTKQFRDADQPSQFVRSLADSPAINKGLFAIEDFDYSVGPLGGHNGGFGWGGPWENISFADHVLESNAVGAGSLKIDYVDHLGNHASLDRQFNRIRRRLSTSFSGVFDSENLIENQDGSRLIGQDGSIVYLSFVQSVSKANDGFYGFELNRGDGNRNRVLCVGHGAARGWLEGPPRAPNKQAGLTNWSVTSEFNGSENKLMEFGELGSATTEPTLIVLKIVFGANNVDEVFVFVNPDPNKESHPLVYGKGNFAFDRIAIANFDGDKSFRVDRVRIGTSYSSVINPDHVPVSIESSQ